jgi:diacylglycerol kinase (ATP)
MSEAESAPKSAPGSVPAPRLPEPVALLVNPSAGPGWRRRRIAAVVEAARRRLPGLSVWPTNGPADAERLAAQAAEKRMGSLLVAGGDGTIHEALQGLAGTDTCLAPLPAGTANVLCRELGLPLDPVAALDRMLAGRPRRVTLGHVRSEAGGGAARRQTTGPHPINRRFVLMLGVGLDAAIVADVPGKVKRVLGAGAYFLQGFLTGMRYPFSEIRVTCDGETLSGTSLVIANARNYAGSFVLAPDAALTRPDLCLVLFEGKGPGAYLGHAFGVLRGRHLDRAGVQVRHASAFTIEGIMPVPAQADGELSGHVPLTVTTEPRALLLVHPDGHAPDGTASKVHP